MLVVAHAGRRRRRQRQGAEHEVIHQLIESHRSRRRLCRHPGRRALARTASPPRERAAACENAGQDKSDAQSLYFLHHPSSGKSRPSVQPRNLLLVPVSVALRCSRTATRGADMTLARLSSACCASSFCASTLSCCSSSVRACRPRRRSQQLSVDPLPRRARGRHRRPSSTRSPRLKSVAADPAGLAAAADRLNHCCSERGFDAQSCSPVMDPLREPVTGPFRSR